MKKSTGIVLSIVLTIALIVGFCFAAEATFKKPDMVETDYLVEPGDTLWSISKQFCPDGYDCRDWIDDVCELNGIKADKIQVGQVITILVEENEHC